jgi:hypothetical protein
VEKLGDFPANLLINQGVMATLHERRLGYHSRSGLEPGTSGFLTLCVNYYATRCKQWMPGAAPCTTQIQGRDSTRSVLHRGAAQAEDTRHSLYL